MSAASLALRPITATDMPFLKEVYFSTRASEMAAVPWSEAEKQFFLEAQFSAQHAHYQQHYPTARFEVIERDGIPLGRLYVDRWAHEIRIMDIALLPEFRGQGLGSGLLRQIQAEAALTHKCVSIHVEKFNPAYRLYLRLGFVHAAQTGETGVYDLLVWNAPPNLVDSSPPTTGSVA